MERPLNSDNLADVPSVAEYKVALRACKSALRSKDGYSTTLEMLKANYYAPDHTVTSGELAQKVGLANYKAANLVYGNYAKVLSAELRRVPKFWVAILVTFADERPDGENVRWTMLPQVATAMEELGWVKQR